MRESIGIEEEQGTEEEEEDIQSSWGTAGGRRWRERHKEIEREALAWDWREFYGRTGLMHRGELEDESDSEVEESLQQLTEGWEERERYRRFAWAHGHAGGKWDLGIATVRAVLYQWEDRLQGFDSMLSAGAYVQECWRDAGWEIHNEAEHWGRRRGGVVTKKGELLKDVLMGNTAEGEPRMVGRVVREKIVLYGMAGVGSFTSSLSL